MTIHDQLQLISDKSKATQTDLWFRIEAELKQEEQPMKKKKRRPARINLSLVAALIGLILIGSILYGMNQRRQYYAVSLDQIQVLASEIDVSNRLYDRIVTVDWAYADPNQAVIALSVTDAEGNPIEANALRHASVELIFPWGATSEYSSMGVTPLINTDGEKIYSTQREEQYIVRFSALAQHFDLIGRVSQDAVNLNERTILDMRVNFFIGSGDHRDDPYRLDFETPYRAPDLVHQASTDNSENVIELEQLDDGIISVQFDELTLTESATSIDVCYRFPPDAEENNTYFPSDVTLYVDGHLVDAETTMNGISEGWFSGTAMGEIKARYALFEGTPDYVFCGSFIWNIRFDDLPNDIRIEIGSISRLPIPHVLETEEQVETFADLLAQAGYAFHDSLAVGDTALDVLRNDDLEGWATLNPQSQYAVLQSVLAEFFTIYEPVALYEGNWEYTFDLR